MKLNNIMDELNQCLFFQCNAILQARALMFSRGGYKHVAEFVIYKSFREMSRILEAKVLNFGKNFFGKVSNFGYNLCQKSWKDFDDDWKKLNNLDTPDFRNNLGNLIINYWLKIQEYVGEKI